MTLSKKNEETQRIYFGHYAYIAGPLGDVFQYLLRSKIHSKQTGKKMALQAISAFWKPFSVQDANEQEARAIALNSIDELQNQIELIKRAFNIKQNHSLLVTRPEIERMIEAKFSQQRRSPRRETARAVPIPDNYNQRKVKHSD